SPPELGRAGVSQNSSITTRSTKAGTVRPGSSRNSFQKRFARASDHCANSGAAAASSFVQGELHEEAAAKDLSNQVNPESSRLCVAFCKSSPCNHRKDADSRAAGNVGPIHSSPGKLRLGSQLGPKPLRFGLG